MFFALYLIKDIALFADWFLLSECFLDSERRVKKIPAVLVSVLAVFNAAAGAWFYSGAGDFTDFDMVTDILSFCLYIAALFSFFHVKNKRSVLLFLFCYNCVTEMIFSIVAPCLPDRIITRLVFYCIFYTVIALVICVCSRFMDLEAFPNIIVTTPKWIFAAIIMFCLACYYRQFGVAASWYEVIYSASSVMMIICICFFIGNTVINTSKINMIYKQMNELSDYCDSLAKSDDELRAFRHDYKNHMQVMSLLLKNGKIGEAEKYIGNLSGSTLSFIKKYSTGNIIFDSILSSKASLAAKNSTTIKFLGYFPPDGIELSDVCTVVSNLIDNAVEACAKMSGENG